MATGQKEAALPPEILEVVQAERLADAPRRCFICLTDEDPSDPSGSWVDPCPCTLEAHQDCMLSWVLDCERTNKPLKCPVCKSIIEMEGPRDLIVAFNDLMHKRFTKTSPYLLLVGMSMGIQFSLQMYGALALWSFAGKNAVMRFLLGPDMVIDARTGGGIRMIRERVWSSLVLMNVAPTLLFSQLLPSLSNKIFLPTASLYGIYQIMHNDTFSVWPPSPQLAMTVFPYVRSIYYNLWRELVLPYEVKLNRQILGLPPVDQNSNTQQDGNQRRQAHQNGEGGFVGLLQGLLDALDPNDDDEDDVIQVNGLNMMNGVANNENEGQGAEVMFELRIEDLGEVERNVNGHDQRADENAINAELEVGAGGELEHGDLQDGVRPVGDIEGQEQFDHAAAPLPPVDAAHGQHEAPQAPPARRMGLGALLSSISNSVVSALILPGVSFTMGEALRLLLPKAWTTSASRNSFAMHAGLSGRPGILQQQWGRSLVGGCLFVVLKDAVRVYAKSRRVAAMVNRRVKNVDRKRK